MHVSVYQETLKDDNLSSVFVNVFGYRILSYGLAKDIDMLITLGNNMNKRVDALWGQFGLLAQMIWKGLWTLESQVNSMLIA